MSEPSEPVNAYERQRACERIISDALLRYACIMVPEVIITGNQITASVRILARPVVEEKP